ncbi:hypothetical protein Ciccas_011439 [Cichlidogyrus casuarinus]|uniref:Uncharacterized protein n=1 Tax=Cichlidogyrus casuarinus TaxID=1844966 RepID=A0ABD2PTB0_9PLAT
MGQEASTSSSEDSFDDKIEAGCLGECFFQCDNYFWAGDAEAHITESEAGRAALNRLELELKAENETKRKKEHPKGAFLTMGENDGLGKLNFSLSYEIKHEILRVHVKEAKHLIGVATTSQKLDLGLRVYLEKIKTDMDKARERVMHSLDPKTANFLNIPPAPTHSSAHRRGLFHSKSKKHLLRESTQEEVANACANRISEPMYGMRIDNTDKPKWNDVFVFRGIKNSQLPFLEAVIEIQDFARKAAIKRPENGFFILGEVRYPCKKIYKRLIATGGYFFVLIN